MPYGINEDHGLWSKKIEKQWASEKGLENRAKQEVSMDEMDIKHRIFGFDTYSDKSPDEMTQEERDRELDFMRNCLIVVTVVFGILGALFILL